MIFTQFLQPPHLRRHEEDSRHATWLELFFDLVLVAAIAQVGHLLVKVSSFSDILVYLGLFWVVFWVWCGHTIYSTRFDTDDFIFRILTFLNMFALIIMAVEVPNAAHGQGFVFGMAFLGSRLVLLALLTRAYIHVKEARHIIRIYLAGFGAGALIWACSLFFHDSTIYWLWGLALSIEALAPWVVWTARYETKNISAEHIPERFGLFTIIVLGENVFAVVKGLENLDWNISSALVAALSFVMAVTIWWIYFQHTERATGQLKLGSGQPYIYSHFPLLSGIVALGTGILMLIPDSGKSLIPEATLGVLIGGYTLWWCGGVLLHYITCPNETRSKNALLRNSVILAVIITIGYMGQTQNAITVMLSLAGLSLLHAFWDGMVRNYAKTQSI